MRVIVMSDLHANVNLPMARVDAGKVSSDRLRDVISVIDQAVDWAAANDIANIFILGDLFDVHKPDGATLVAVSRSLARAAKMDVIINVLPGNHDAVDRNGHLYNLQLYKELDMPGIRILGHEHVEVTEGIRLHAVPWLPESRVRKRIRARQRDLTDGDHDWLLLHQTVAGAIGDSGWVSKDGLDGAILDGFTGCLSGHYHKPQRHAWGMYLGSPLHLKFSEADVTKRGFWVLDLTHKLDKSNPKLVVPDYPRFGTDELMLEAGDNIEDLLDIAEASEGLAYLRLSIRGDAAAIERSRATTLEWQRTCDRYGLRRIKVDERPRIEDKQRLKLESPTFVLSEAMDAYVDEFKGEDDDAATLRETGSRLLSQARSL